MGKRRNERKAKFDCKEGDLESPNPAFVFDDSNDEEANEDLSLKIVEKAMSRVASRGTRKEHDGGNSVFTENPDIITSELVESKSVHKKSRRVKKKHKKCETEAKSDEKEEQMAENVQAVKLPEVPEENAVDNSNPDNIVLRKLLRGPRYFDPPNSSWGTCYNCGEEGHSAANCTSARRKKPCYVCGSFEHGAKQCQKGQDCYICKESSHRAKDCPKKFEQCIEGSDLCLKCGASGHAMSSCNNDYSPDDLKEIQCYVCKSFGHLCCAKYVDAPAEVSCYKCGLFGHAGLRCRGSRGETAGSGSSSVCFKCDEVGHFARECTSATKGCRGSRWETNGSSGSSSVCYNCDEVGHFARECTSATKVKKRNRDLSTPSKRFSRSDKVFSHVQSAPEYHIKGHKKKKMHLEEESYRSINGKKRRGGWITDDPGDFPHQTTYSNGWRSPSTPDYKHHPISRLTSGGHISSPRNQKALGKFYPRSSNVQGSSNVSHNTYSASRFGNVDHYGMRRDYSPW